MLKISKSLTSDVLTLNAPAKFLGLLKPLATVQSRGFKTDTNFEWVPPPKISCIHPTKSGDQSPLPEADPSALRYKFARANPNQEMFVDSKDISPEIKKLATLEFASKREQIQVIKKDFLGKVKRHDLDCGSYESQITCLTVRIRQLQNHMDRVKYDKIVKVQLKELIDQRNSYLKHLRRFDYKRFEWLLEKLDIVYYAPINYIEPVTKKGAMRKLTTYYCEKLRNERLEAYKAQLAKEKEAFLKEKEDTLKWIEKEEEELEKLIQ